MNCQQTCSTFSNWCTRKIPHISLPAEPASFRKHVENPAYLRGSWVLGSSNHSPEWYADIGCSEVAIRYFSSSLAITWSRQIKTRIKNGEISLLCTAPRRTDRVEPSSPWGLCSWGRVVGVSYTVSFAGSRGRRRSKLDLAIFRHLWESSHDVPTPSILGQKG